MKERLDKVLGFDGGVTTPKTKAETAVLDTFKEEDLSAIDKKLADDDDVDYFKSLAEQD